MSAIIDYSRIIYAEKVPAFIRMLAHDLQRQVYMMPGEFFSKLSDHDLKYLHDCVETSNNLTQDEDDALPDCIVHLFYVSAMLCMAEGGDLTEENADQVQKTTASFVVLEHLYRMGLIDVFRDSYSYIDLDVPIAQAKPT